MASNIYDQELSNTKCYNLQNTIKNELWESYAIIQTFHSFSVWEKVNQILQSNCIITHRIEFRRPQIQKEGKNQFIQQVNRWQTEEITALLTNYQAEEYEC